MENESDGPPNASVMVLDLLDKKIRRLICKLKKFNIDLEEFSHEAVEYGALLGKGGEGMVRRCTVIYNGVKVEAAAKTVTDNSEDAVSITLDEIELLCLANDPIINTTQKVYGVVAQPCDEDPQYGRLVIITEAGLMNALQLYQEEPVPLHVTLELWSRLAAALHTMHSKKIIHQDLKPENILITAINRDKFGQICKIDFKVIDLGMAKRVYTEKIVTDDILGTNGYHAPEVLFEESYDFRADIFMLGITFCVLLHSPEFLKSSELAALLKKLHSAKQDKVAGEELFNSVVKPKLAGYADIPDNIHNMICTMLELAEDRLITLLDISNLCRETASELAENGGPDLTGSDSNHAFPAAHALPGMMSGGADSGFECGLSGQGGAGDADVSNNKSQTQGRRRLRRARRVSSRAQSPANSGRSISSVFSTQSDFHAQARRMTRSQSVTSVTSDITVCSDVTDLRRASRNTHNNQHNHAAASHYNHRRRNPPRSATPATSISGTKRLRSESTLPTMPEEGQPPARRSRPNRFVDYKEFYA